MVNDSKETLTDMDNRKRENPSSVRSKSLLKKAFLSLLQDEPLASISVSQICSQAQLTRPTFYNHFDSKEAIAAAMVDDILEGFSEHMRQSKVGSTQDMLRLFLDYWESQWGLLQLLSNNGLLPLVGERFKPHLERIYETMPFTNKEWDEEELAFHNAFLAAGMTGMLDHWARSGSKTGAAQLTAYMEHMIATLDAGMGRRRS